ncbi:hypothetical protein PUN28_018339 [Cardiocondyla obscurior]|uniref:Uncharacterized protein n=1 Tax=Cardiocondyla obscurior TaxID=286306 RepID=A0AAW2EHY5_9HYME
MRLGRYLATVNPRISERRECYEKETTWKAPSDSESSTKNRTNQQKFRRGEDVEGKRRPGKHPATVNHLRKMERANESFGKERMLRGGCDLGEMEQIDKSSGEERTLREGDNLEGIG